MERLRGHIDRTDLPALVVGATLLVIAAGTLALSTPDSRLLLAMAFLAPMAIIDTLTHRIPNSLTVAMMLSGLGLAFLGDGPGGAGRALTGLLLGGGLLLPFYLADAVGAGDVKALAGIGAVLGPLPLLQVALWSGLIGGLVALAHLTAGRWRRQSTDRFAYAPVLALATLAWGVWGSVLPH